MHGQKNVEIYVKDLCAREATPFIKSENIFVARFGVLTAE